jgi:hypothetical protein
MEAAHVARTERSGRSQEGKRHHEYEEHENQSHIAERFRSLGKPLPLVFGTGWGLAPSVVESADELLEPICARENGSYNHLSVRSACAIAMDRLCGAP